MRSRAAPPHPRIYRVPPPGDGMWVEFIIGSRLLSGQVLPFTPSSKINISKFQFDQKSWTKKHIVNVLLENHYLVIYYFFIAHRERFCELSSMNPNR